MLEKLMETVLQASEENRSHYGLANLLTSGLTPATINEPRPSSTSLLFDEVIGQHAGANTSMSAPPSVLSSNQNQFASVGRGRPIGRIEKLQQSLVAMLPCQEDVDYLSDSSHGWWLIKQHIMPHLFRSPDTEIQKILDVSAASTAHPIFIARLLLCLALCIQQLSPDVDPKRLRTKVPLSETVEKITTFIPAMVTSDDELIGSVEGMECLIMQAAYHVNEGNLRRAWLMFRRSGRPVRAGHVPDLAFRARNLGASAVHAARGHRSAVRILARLLSQREPGFDPEMDVGAVREAHGTTFCSTLVEFQAFTSVITLLLGLFGPAQFTSDPVGVRERSEDLQLVETVVRILEGPRRNGAGMPVVERCVSAIRSIQAVLLDDPGSPANLRLTIPYFGTIGITRGAAVRSFEGERILGANPRAASSSAAVAAIPDLTSMEEVNNPHPARSGAPGSGSTTALLRATGPGPTPTANPNNASTSTTPAPPPRIQTPYHHPHYYQHQDQTVNSNSTNSSDDREYANDTTTAAAVIGPSSSSTDPTNNNNNTFLQFTSIHFPTYEPQQQAMETGGGSSSDYDYYDNNNSSSNHADWTFQDSDVLLFESLLNADVEGARF